MSTISGLRLSRSAEPPVRSRTEGVTPEELELLFGAPAPPARQKNAILKERPSGSANVEEEISLSRPAAD